MVVDKGVNGLNVRELLSRVCPGREFTASELEAASIAVSSFMTMDGTSRMHLKNVSCQLLAINSFTVSAAILQASSNGKR